MLRRMHVLVVIALVAVAGVAGCGNDSSSPIAPEDTVPPAGVANLHVRVYTVGQPRVSLNWSNNSEPDLVNYRVYRTESRDTTDKRGDDRIAMSIVAEPTNPLYVDTDVLLGERYGYCVTAIDHAGNESARVDATVLVIPPAGRNSDDGVD